MTIGSGLRKATMLAGLALGLFFAQAPATPAAAGVPGDDAVLLDPFDPVPQIGFRHPDCFDPCGYHRCEHDCRRVRHRCEHECCDEMCLELYWAHMEALHRYWQQANTYDMLLGIYMDELRAYDLTYLDGTHFRELWHRYGVRAFHDGPPPDGYDGPPEEYYRQHNRDGEGPPGDGGWHDGDRPDGRDGDRRDDGYHDGDHHDDGHHDGDRRDGYDGDHHDDGYHDGDHHDGDGHDGDHHDSHEHDDGWYDRDGHWHDGPPPGAYPH
ncbi:MAG: hypothetical protein ACREHE_06940 [Rhizomicrobium sp.]